MLRVCLRANERSNKQMVSATSKGYPAALKRLLVGAKRKIGPERGKCLGFVASSLREWDWAPSSFDKPAAELEAVLKVHFKKGF